ncbi:MAG: protein nirF [Deltaproteobacteria bacterium]|nr:protein nirF [Deltaproteobacteria bacterium]
MRKVLISTYITACARSAAFIMLFLFCALAGPYGDAHAGGIGSRVLVVERATGSLAIYDYQERKLLPKRIEGLGNLRHALMAFTPDLRYAFLATRNGQLSRIDLTSMEVAGGVFTSENSIDIAISQDGRYIATAEYQPGGITILDAQTLKVVKRIPTSFQHNGQEVPTRVTGIVDAPGNRFVAVQMEGARIMLIDASKPDFPVEHSFPTVDDMPYDAMITPDGRFYLVGHIESPRVSILDLHNLNLGVREISLLDPGKKYDKGTPFKMPHMASWAVAGNKVFVPLVGEDRLAVLDGESWKFIASVPLRGHPVYAVVSPTGKEIWVSFSGEKDDSYIQVVDTRSMKVTKELKIGRRIYHMDFTPRGAYLLVTANLDNKLFLVNANTYKIEDEQTLNSPSGVFGVWRAYRIGL